MTQVTLHRIPSTPQGTFGLLSVDGAPVATTCEDPWEDNAKGISCIPPGKYHCVPHESDKFPGTWELQNVPNRTAILIHAGNTINDTHGCILVGNGFSLMSGLPGILNSRRTLDMLRVVLPPSFELTIK